MAGFSGVDIVREILILVELVGGSVALRRFKL